MLTNPDIVVQARETLDFQGPIGLCIGQAPYIEPELFVGRDQELMEMKRVLVQGVKSGKQRRLTIGGMGGIGKTQLAIAYCTRHQDEHPSIMWLNAANEAL